MYITSAKGLLSLLDEPDNELKVCLVYIFVIKHFEAKIDSIYLPSFFWTRLGG